MVDDQDKEIYYPMSFLEQMTWDQEDIEHILNNNTLESMRSAGVERFGEPGYGESLKLRRNYYYLFMMNTQI